MKRLDRRNPRLGLFATFFVLLALLVVLPTDRAFAQAVPPTCPASLGTADLIDHNFTDFSDDLTDLNYDHHGVFLNVIGTF
jgi:hypothetical protein